MMNSLDALLKSTDFAQKINNQLGFSNSMMKMMQSQELWQKQIGAMTMHGAIFKMAEQQQAIIKKSFAGTDLLSKTLAMQAKLFQIPQPTLDAIRGISQMQESLFGSLKGLSVIVESNKSYLAQINSLQFAMSGISGQIAAIAAKNNQWSLLDEFEDINEQAFEITNSFTSDIALTEEEAIKFEQLIETVFEFIKRNKKLGINAYRFLNLIALIICFHQYYDFLKPKPELVTKVNLADFERKIFQAIELKFKKEKEYRTTNRVSKIMLKPRVKTILVATLPKGFDVIVLQINHKWALVSYTNPKDNLMETGWIMKKYLNK